MIRITKTLMTMMSPMEDLTGVVFLDSPSLEEPHLLQREQEVQTVVQWLEVSRLLLMRQPKPITFKIWQSKENPKETKGVDSLQEVGGRKVINRPCPTAT